MTELVQVAVVSGIPPTLAVLVSMGFNIYTAHNANKKLDQIHTLTNSNLSAATAAAVAANHRCDELEKIVQGLVDERKGLLPTGTTSTESVPPSKSATEIKTP